jgi:predicted O-methyltransferase YrrM
MATPLEDGGCALRAPEVKAVLDRLHTRARRQRAIFLKIAGLWGIDALLRRKPSIEEEARRFKNILIPLSPKAGAFAYLVARSIGARRIVEFGTSFGVSTVYLAAAVRDNGGGIVIGSEIEKAKIAAARANLEQAGLGDQVEIRAGDAQQTLRDPGGSVDLALLDGWKDLYLPIIEILTPHLRHGAVVLADNIMAFPRALAPYVAHVRDLRNGFQSVTLALGQGMEYSVRL